jgi:hypothetical protein
MTREPAELYQVWILCGLLSCVAAWIIARRYRRRMQQLMRAPRTGDSAAPVAEAVADRPAGAPASLADNRAAGMRLTMLLIISSCLVAGTSAGIYSALMFPADPLMLWRVIPIAVLHMWPVIFAMGMMWRWSRAGCLGALLLWCAATWVVLFAIGLWRQIDMAPLLVLQIMASEIGLSLVLLSLVFLGDATRAIAPWLLLPTALLAWSSLAGVQAMVFIGEGQSPLLTSLIGCWIRCWAGCPGTVCSYCSSCCRGCWRGGPRGCWDARSGARIRAGGSRTCWRYTSLSGRSR